MAGKIKVLVEPGIMKFARESMRLSLKEAARRCGLKEELLSKAEMTAAAFSIPKLEKIANAYRRPSVFFLLKKVPDGAAKFLPGDYRLAYESDQMDISDEILTSVRRARYVQEVIAEFNEPRQQQRLPALAASNVESVSSQIREVLGVTLITQSKWGTPNEAFRSWKQCVEKIGIYVLQESMPSDTIRAFSLVDKAPYIIVVNSSEHEYGRIFSLFHELGHVLMRNSGVCTLDPNSLHHSVAYKKIETVCNAFAANLLVPTADFKKNSIAIQLAKKDFKEWSDDELRRIGNGFRVSKEVILRKFLTLGVIDDLEYKERRKEWAEEDKKIKKKSDKPIIIPPERLCISHNGQSFVSLVLKNYHAQKITLNRVGEYLEISPRFVSRVEASIS